MEDADPASRLDLQRRAADQLLLAGHFAEGFEQLRLLLAEVGVRLPSSPRMALVSLLKQRAHLRLRRLGWKERHEKEISPSELARLDAFQVVSDGLGMVDNIRGADFQSRSLILALRLGERKRVAHALCMESVYQASQGIARTTRARSLIEEARRIGESSQDAHTMAMTHVAFGVIEFLAGRYPRAVELLRVGEVAFRDQTVGSTWQLDNARVFRLHVHRHTGELKEIRRLFEDYVRDAEKRGDQYMEASMRRLSVEAWLCRDLVSEARENLERAEWSPPEGGFHMQHYYELLERTKIALYEGKAADALEELRPGFAALDRSLLTRMQVIQAEAWWMWSRLAVSAATSHSRRAWLLRRAARLARRLGRQGVPYSTVWSESIRAAIATQKGSWRAAVDLLRSVIDKSEQYAMPCMTACARRRLGSLLKGDEGAQLVAQSEAWMTAEDVVNIDRITEVYTPGFAPR
jgi:hypothetical protein